MRASHGIVAGVAAAGLGLLMLLPATADEGPVPHERRAHPAIEVTLDPAAVDAYATLLVETAVADLERPTRSVPEALAGVLGPKADAVERRNQFLAQRHQAALDAWLAAHTRVAPTSRTAARGGSRCNGDFSCFKPCTLEIESHGNYAAVSPGGTYRGAWQFDQRTWNGAVARAGYPEWSNRDPAQAPAPVQDAAARQLYAERGNQPWGGRC